MKKLLLSLGVLGAVFIACSPAVFAQEQTVVTLSKVEVGDTRVFAEKNADEDSQVVSQMPQMPVALEVKSMSVQESISPSDIPSLFFTPDALALIRDAIRGLNTSSLADAGDGSEKDPGIRELALGGIIYKSDKDWAILLNGLRITPDTIPGEILDLKVSKDYVDIKWYDAYTNRLFPVRLRTNERFNLDSRLFLMGAHSEDQRL